MPILRFKKFFISAISVLFIFVVVVIVLVFTVIVVDVVIAIVVFVIIIIIAVDVIIGLGCFGDRICRCRNISGGTDYFLNQFLTALLSAVYQLVDLLIQNSPFQIKKLSFLIQFYNLCFQN